MQQQDTLIPPGCLLTRTKIIALPTVEFNRLMVKEKFSEEQKANLKGLRRKWRNDVHVMSKFMKYVQFQS